MIRLPHMRSGHPLAGIRCVSASATTRNRRASKPSRPISTPPIQKQRDVESIFLELARLQPRIEKIRRRSFPIAAVSATVVAGCVWVLLELTKPVGTISFAPTILVPVAWGVTLIAMGWFLWERFPGSWLIRRSEKFEEGYRDLSSHVSKLQATMTSLEGVPLSPKIADLKAQAGVLIQNAQTDKKILKAQALYGDVDINALVGDVELAQRFLYVFGQARELMAREHASVDPSLRQGFEAIISEVEANLTGISFKQKKKRIADLETRLQALSSFYR